MLLYSSDIEQESLVNESLSSPFKLICRNAFSMSPRSRFADIRALTIMSQRSGCNGGPVNIQSLMLLAKGWGLALASNTMRTFVVTAVSFTTGLLWHVKYSLSRGIRRRFLYYSRFELLFDDAIVFLFQLLIS